MRFINKAGLVAGGLTALLILASCSDSDTSTGVTTGRQAANDSSTQTVMHQATAGEGEHSDTDSAHSHSPDQQHGELGEVVTTSSVLALAAIPASTCGNLIQEAGEQCDGGLSGNATCNADCTHKTQRGEVIATTFCGNGSHDSGEQCDDGNDSNEDDCTRFCKIAVCGDGYTQPGNGEQCDDKNKVDSDSCNNKCQRQQSTTVVTTTTVSTVDNTGGGTDIVLTNTVEDIQMDVVTSSDDSGTHTQRSAISDDTNGTPTVVAITNDTLKAGETPTTPQILTPRECKVNTQNIYDACVAEYEDSPRCTTYIWQSRWYIIRHDALSVCGRKLEHYAVRDSETVLDHGLTTREGACKWVEMGVDDDGMYWEGQCEEYETEYQCTLEVNDCEAHTHDDQCKYEASDLYTVCLNEYSNSMGTD